LLPGGSDGAKLRSSDPLGDFARPTGLIVSFGGLDGKCGSPAVQPAIPGSIPDEKAYGGATRQDPPIAGIRSLCLPLAADSPFSPPSSRNFFPPKGPAFTASPIKRNNKAGWAGKNPRGTLDRSFAPSDPQGQRQSLLVQSKRGPLGFFPAQPVIFVTLQYLAIKVKAGKPRCPTSNSREYPGRKGLWRCHAAGPPDSGIRSLCLPLAADSPPHPGISSPQRTRLYGLTY
jgi:hypothetical protein